MSNSLIKSYNLGYAAREEQKKKRVIDSNQAVSDRIKALSEILESVPQDDFVDEFSEGLDAEQVDALLADQEEVAAERAKNEAAQKLIDEANEQVEQMLADVREQAERIIEEANARAEGIFEEARAKGEAEGNERGYAEGLQRASELEKAAEEKAAALDEEFDAKMSELEPKFVSTLTDIYSHVFGIDLSGRSDVVVNLLKDAIRNIEGAKNFLVHVSRDDREYVNEHRDELTEGLGASATVEIIEDVTLTEGNCFIETDGGIYDCSLGTEMELLKKELRVLSYTQKDG
ncbi:MAG: hypothetical protein K6F73_05295 [Lachnospiraceae bacterium]|nr:hypothetical protein [Lachnospiraceae bacterium]